MITGINLFGFQKSFGFFYALLFVNWVEILHVHSMKVICIFFSHCTYFPTLIFFEG